MNRLSQAPDRSGDACCPLPLCQAEAADLDAGVICPPSLAERRHDWAEHAQMLARVA